MAIPKKLNHPPYKYNIIQMRHHYCAIIIKHIAKIKHKNYIIQCGNAKKSGAEKETRL